VILSRAGGLPPALVVYREERNLGPGAEPDVEMARADSAIHVELAIAQLMTTPDIQFAEPRQERRAKPWKKNLSAMGMTGELERGVGVHRGVPHDIRFMAEDYRPLTGGQFIEKPEGGANIGRGFKADERQFSIRKGHPEQLVAQLGDGQMPQTLGHRVNPGDVIMVAKDGEDAMSGFQAAENLRQDGERCGVVRGVIAEEQDQVRFQLVGRFNAADEVIALAKRIEVEIGQQDEPDLGGRGGPEVEREGGGGNVQLLPLADETISQDAQRHVNGRREKGGDSGSGALDQRQRVRKVVRAQVHLGQT